MQHMSNIFISYRRQDATETATRLYEALGNYFGRLPIFQDVEAIPPGADFAAYLRDTIAQCAVMLVVIGPSWLTLTDTQGRPRLTAPTDWVRTEIELAQQHHVQVIPVLANGARMPQEEELPPSIQFLARANAHALRPDQGFRDDATHLIEKILAVARLLTPVFDWQEALSRARQGDTPSEWKVYGRDISYLRRFGGFALFGSLVLFVVSGIVSGQQSAGYPTGGSVAAMGTRARLLLLLGLVLAVAGAAAAGPA